MTNRKTTFKYLTLFTMLTALSACDQNAQNDPSDSPSPVCGGSGLYDDCFDDVCEEGQTRCSDDRLGILSCVDGYWGAIQACDEPKECVAQDGNSTCEIVRFDDCTTLGETHCVNDAQLATCVDTPTGNSYVTTDCAPEDICLNHYNPQNAEIIEGECTQECPISTCGNGDPNYGCPATKAELLGTGQYCFYPKDDGSYDHWGDCYRGMGNGQQCCYDKNGLDNCSGSPDLVSPIPDTWINSPATPTDPYQKCRFANPIAARAHCKADVLTFCAAHCEEYTYGWFGGITGYANCGGWATPPEPICDAGPCADDVYNDLNHEWSTDTCGCTNAIFDGIQLLDSDFPAPNGWPEPPTAGFANDWLSPSNVYEKRCASEG